ncbi:MAG: AAA family ATPase [Pirellulales bacterium]|nr:AAA family ATPase [Pirellulales bacterium]
MPTKRRSLATGRGVRIMGRMSTFEIPDLPSQFRQLLGTCRELYVSSGELAAREHAHLLPESGDKFVQLMDDLHQALVVKVFVAVCEADRRWSKNEQFLAEVLIFHLWSQWLSEEQIKEALQAMSTQAMGLKWYALVRPFDQIAPLRNRIADVEAIVIRLANIVARADGPIKPPEAARVKSIQEELELHLRQIPIDEPSEHAEAERAGAQAIEKIFSTGDALPAVRKEREKNRGGIGAKPGGKIAPSESVAETTAEKPPAERLADSLAELDKLIGLDNIKEEVRTLANFLKVQQKRAEAGLPNTNLSLHMVFGGNPGTGKTTVARIVGNIFGAMGVLKKGHLVETDRSGLVAEYAGQTGPKSNKKIDEALDGVLFIDEAYTLIASEGEDPFGHEAVQTLLKRMEDDRERLVVILAGYPVEMALLLRSNPGLSSRFSRHLDFKDYTPLELASIFGLMCGKNLYQLCDRTRGKAMLGFTWMFERRDRHFGNGRTVRNLFEDAIRRQANRIAEITDLSVEQLSTLEPADLQFERVPAEEFARLDDPSLRFHLSCGKCEHGKDVPLKFLGQSVKCPKCENQFIAEWGEAVRADDGQKHLGCATEETVAEPGDNAAASEI